MWVGAAPYLLFIPHDEKTDKPRGEPKILLDGWGYEDTHETLNTFIWGPDGWLYGCHGVFTHSRRRQAGHAGREAACRSTPASGAITRRSTSSRSSPTARANPWGLDYNANGDFFIEACVIPHMWHIIQGGRYAAAGGAALQPVHLRRHQDDRRPPPLRRREPARRQQPLATRAGGGHAHAGLMCYQGGHVAEGVPRQAVHGQPARPPHQRGRDHAEGQRLRRGPQPGLPADERQVVDPDRDFKSGPDGNVYLIDWYDKQICHLHAAREAGTAPTAASTRSATRTRSRWRASTCRRRRDEELVKYQAHENEWYVRTARRLLQERCGRDRKSGCPRFRALCEVHRLHRPPTDTSTRLWATARASVRFDARANHRTTRGAGLSGPVRQSSGLGDPAVDGTRSDRRPTWSSSLA